MSVLFMKLRMGYNGKWLSWHNRSSDRRGVTLSETTPSAHALCGVSNWCESHLLLCTGILIAALNHEILWNGPLEMASQVETYP